MGDIGPALRLAREQRGIVSREQLSDLGLSPATIRTWVDRGLWAPVGRKVLVLLMARRGFLERSLIAAHRAGPESCLTGQSALVAAGVAGDPPWDALPAPGSPWLLNPVCTDVGARVIRRREDRVLVAYGVKVAQAEVVMLDLLRYLPEGDARDLVFRAMGVYRWEGFLARLSALADALGRARGVRRLRRFADLAASAARSRAEELSHSLLRHAGISGWHANYPVRIRGRTVVVDLAFPEPKVAIEVDGRAYHGSSRFQYDRTRQNLLVTAGWTVLRFTWEDLTRRPDDVVAQVRAVLRAAGASEAR